MPAVKADLAFLHARRHLRQSVRQTFHKFFIQFQFPCFVSKEKQNILRNGTGNAHGHFSSFSALVCSPVASSGRALITGSSYGWTARTASSVSCRRSVRQTVSTLSSGSQESSPSFPRKGDVPAR